MADRVPRKLHYRDGPIEKTWPDREDLSEAEILERAAGYPEAPEGAAPEDEPKEPHEPEEPHPTDG